MCKTLLFPHGFSFHSLIHASSFGKLYTNFTNFHCFPYLISNLLAVDGLPNFPMPRPHEDGRFERLARHLRKGHLVAFPTETVWVAPSDNVIVNIVIPKINVNRGIEESPGQVAKWLAMAGCESTFSRKSVDFQHV